MLLSLIGYVYMNMVWDLASVVLVLEDLSGLRALKRSNDLLKGKRWVGCVTFVVFRGWASALHMSGIGEVVTVKRIGCFLGELEGSIGWLLWKMWKNWGSVANTKEDA
ncbi:hypothetical protein Scep_018964 [Stephania cephalantha]|uniref:Transmembrane protein n=1 Tax=Stephania cephalantha TaxID=152367 RepID=A0AAP0NMS8_9MAGN